MRTPTDSPHGITLQRYAEVMAYLRGCPGEECANLAQLGLPEAAWREGAGVWLQSIEADLAQGRYDLAIAFAEEYAPARARLRRGGAADAPRPEVAPAEQQPAAAQASHAGLPSYLLRTASIALRETTEFDLRAVMAKSVPFLPAAEHRPPAKALEPPPALCQAVGAGAGGRPGRAALVDTAPLDPRAVASSPMPFKAPLSGGGADVAPAAPAAVEAPGSRTHRAASAEPGAIRAGETGDLDLHRVGSPALPFENAAERRRSADGAQLMSLEQYASLCAELSVRPTEVSQIRARYLVPNEESHRALGRLWGERFERDPELRVRFEQLCGGRRARLLRGGD